MSNLNFDTSFKVYLKELFMQVTFFFFFDIKIFWKLDSESQKKTPQNKPKIMVEKILAYHPHA